MTNETLFRLLQTDEETAPNITHAILYVQRTYQQSVKYLLSRENTRRILHMFFHSPVPSFSTEEAISRTSNKEYNGVS